MILGTLLTLLVIAVLLGLVGSIAFGGATVGAGWGIARLLERMHQATRRRRALAEELGLTLRHWGLVGRQMVGVRHGHPVTVRWRRGDHGSWVEVIAGGVPQHLELRPAWPLRLALAPGPPVRVGDPTVDELALRGPREVVLPVLGRDETRQVVREAFARRAPVVGRPRVEVGSGEVVVRRAGRGRDAATVTAMLDQATTLAQALTPSASPDQLLLDNARNATPVDVRLRCLRLLVARGADEADAAAAAALDDADPRIRLEAAWHLGRPEPLVALVESPDTPAPTRLQALEALEAFPEAARIGVLTALQRPDPDLLVTALRVAGTVGATDALPAMAALLDGPLKGWGHGDGWERVRPVALALARALGRLDTPEAEPVLIQLLDAPSNEVRVEAMTALGEVGTPAAVQPILDHAARPFPRLRRTAEQAVARIQSRVEHGGAGALSLAEVPDAQGALSITPPDTGALSLPTEPLPTDDQDDDRNRRGQEVNVERGPDS